MAKYDVCSFCGGARRLRDQVAMDAHIAGAQHQAALCEWDARHAVATDRQALHRGQVALGIVCRCAERTKVA